MPGEYPCDQCPLFSDCQDPTTPEISDHDCPKARLEAGLPEWPAPAVHTQDLPTGDLDLGIPETEADGEPFTPAIPLIRPRPAPRPASESSPPRAGQGYQGFSLPETASSPARRQQPPAAAEPPPAAAPEEPPARRSRTSATSRPDRIRMKTLWDEGLPRSEIARRTGFSGSTVGKVLTVYYGILPGSRQGPEAPAPLSLAPTYTPEDRADIQHIRTQNDEILRLLRGGLRFSG